VYGPGERAGTYGTLIEIFKQQRASGKSLTVRLPGTQERIFTHVDDIVDGLVLVGEKGAGDEFGLGAEESFSILEVARMFGGEIEMLPERKGNRTNAKLDATKSHGLGWKASRKLADYIEEIRGA
jgi:UDP-glucose 4-epimerase